MFAVNSTYAGNIKNGRVRAISVTSMKANAAFPGVPAMSSVAPGFDVNLWTAIFVPTGAPAALVQRLDRQISEIAKSKELSELLHSDGATPLALSPDESARRVRDSYAMWKRIATARNIVID